MGLFSKSKFFHPHRRAREQEAIANAQIQSINTSLNRQLEQANIQAQTAINHINQFFDNEKTRINNIYLEEKQQAEQKLEERLREITFTKARIEKEYNNHKIRLINDYTIQQKSLAKIKIEQTIHLKNILNILDNSELEKLLKIEFTEIKSAINELTNFNKDDSKRLFLYSKILAWIENQYKFSNINYSEYKKFKKFLQVLSFNKKRIKQQFLQISRITQQLDNWLLQHKTKILNNYSKITNIHSNNTDNKKKIKNLNISFNKSIVSMQKAHEQDLLDIAKYREQMLSELNDNRLSYIEQLSNYQNQLLEIKNASSLNIESERTQNLNRLNTELSNSTREIERVYHKQLQAIQENLENNLKQMRNGRWNTFGNILAAVGGAVACTFVPNLAPIIGKKLALGLAASGATTTVCGLKNLIEGNNKVGINISGKIDFNNSNQSNQRSIDNDIDNQQTNFTLSEFNPESFINNFKNYINNLTNKARDIERGLLYSINKEIGNFKSPPIKIVSERDNLAIIPYHDPSKYHNTSNNSDNKSVILSSKLTSRQIAMRNRYPTIARFIDALEPKTFIKYHNKIDVLMSKNGFFIKEANWKGYLKVGTDTVQILKNKFFQISSKFSLLDVKWSFGANNIIRDDVDNQIIKKDKYENLRQVDVKMNSGTIDMQLNKVCISSRNCYKTHISYSTENSITFSSNLSNQDNKNIWDIITGTKITTNNNMLLAFSLKKDLDNGEETDILNLNFDSNKIINNIKNFNKNIEDVNITKIASNSINKN